MYTFDFQHLKFVLTFFFISHIFNPVPLLFIFVSLWRIWGVNIQIQKKIRRKKFVEKKFVKKISTKYEKDEIQMSTVLTMIFEHFNKMV